ncbi:NADH:flavin oxidoreductase [Pseudoteredinibacter isoporae]|uniref:2,4-dienoyl-CoA reductase-like NADH-dependent reductase (Old Yellow Enzyme family) n=1 Tax=Pseudoteredinibacter isoporae TaxID=570281 RepID=A0A7X0JWT5_9GAMM|nr:NADH:flavin oxidoreductase [Pseudoteredinibacter isoporae]MBB6523657.1 2,4-dienoyl-CoA reductase-like NADH-dependent reductase (Old Yellow Enzyme family) [Pseudoteredinibacter isoporae]NHO89161.1 NADH:flavin oxidoreductase [Pseudoteredinibacter isoporae]NIB22228.1 NADH:flavin oxidoreductase [Pseudoteredinibacter isoporae]
MWKPPQRIKYTPLDQPWPSQEEAEQSRLFQSFQHGPLHLAQRSWIPAMVPWRATDEGFVSKNVLDWYRRFAEGQPGAIVIEATGIRDVPSGPLLRIGHDRYIEGLRKLTQTVHEASAGQTKVFIQLIDFLSIRRRPEPEKFFQRFLSIDDALRERYFEFSKIDHISDADLRNALSELKEDELAQVLDARQLESLYQGFRERVFDPAPHLQELPQVLPSLFAEAAERAKAAGFDGIELHYAHAYTMASFLSASNVRTDGYGGSRENRVRLPLEVFHAVRNSVGNDYPVGCRFLSEEIITGGSTLEDAQFFATEFARAGMDFISLSRGGKFDDAKRPKVGQAAYPYTGQSGYECMPSFLSDEQGPFGRNISPTASIRESIRAAGCDTPVVVAGGIHSYRQAEEILQSDQADIIGIARQAIADPDWFRKVKSGCGKQVRLCEYSNYCERLDQHHKEVTCNLWDKEGREEKDVVLSQDGRRRLIAPAWKPGN